MDGAEHDPRPAVRVEIPGLGVFRVAAPARIRPEFRAALRARLLEASRAARLADPPSVPRTGSGGPQGA